MVIHAISVACKLYPLADQFCSLQLQHSRSRKLSQNIYTMLFPFSLEQAYPTLKNGTVVNLVVCFFVTIAIFLWVKLKPFKNLSLLKFENENRAIPGPGYLTSMYFLIQIGLSPKSELTIYIYKLLAVLNHAYFLNKRAAQRAGILVQKIWPSLGIWVEWDLQNGCAQFSRKRQSNLIRQS